MYVYTCTKPEVATDYLRLLRQHLEQKKKKNQDMNQLIKRERD